MPEMVRITVHTQKFIADTPYTPGLARRLLSTKKPLKAIDLIDKPAVANMKRKKSNAQGSASCLLQPYDYSQIDIGRKKTKCTKKTARDTDSDKQYSEEPELDPESEDQDDEGDSLFRGGSEDDSLFGGDTEDEYTGTGDTEPEHGNVETTKEMEIAGLYDNVL